VQWDIFSIARKLSTLAIELKLVEAKRCIGGRIHKLGKN
jgi:hypothetical protein